MQVKTTSPFEGMQSLPPLPKRVRPSKASSREPQQKAEHQFTMDRSDCIPQLHLSILGKSLNALAVWVHFHGSGSIRFRDEA